MTDGGRRAPSRPHTTNRYRRRALLAAGVTATAGTLMLLSANGADATQTKQIVTICHAHASTSNPYGSIDVDVSGGWDGHDTHTGPVFSDSLAKNVQWGDIIPLTTMPDGTTFSLNWDAAGQAIWNNGCALPSAAGSTATVTQTVTATATQTVTATATQTVTEAAPTVTATKTVTEAAPTVTVTEAGPTVTKTEAGPTVTQVVPVTETVTHTITPAPVTVTETVTPQPQTVTVTAPGATVTETVTPAPETVTKTVTAAPETVTQTITEAGSPVTVTAAPATVTETKTETATQTVTASPATVTATVTETAPVAETSSASSSGESTSSAAAAVSSSAAVAGTGNQNEGGGVAAAGVAGPIPVGANAGEHAPVKREGLAIWGALLLIGGGLLGLSAGVRRPRRVRAH